MNSLFFKAVMFTAVGFLLSVVNYYTAPMNSLIREKQIKESVQLTGGKVTDTLSLISDFFQGEIGDGRYRVLNVEASTFVGEKKYPAVMVRVQRADGVCIDLIGSRTVCNHIHLGDWIIVRGREVKVICLHVLE